ncbi:MAG TPA: LpqB family beta-propeller domain-containing protein [Pyrinomonadaceae bacterium]|nr:LpqB family beta-propeller domain-containing protein [Pyrinomonadaceae bacterium]
MNIQIGIGRLLTVLSFAALLLAMPTVTAAQPRIERIAFESNRDTSNSLEIYLMKTDGTGLVRLTNNAAIDASPAISPDGRKIAFTSDRDGNYEIYVMNVDGTNQVRLTTNAAADSGPSWNADGSKIAFTSTRDNNNEIYVINADGTNPVNLTNSPTIQETQPSFSKDGAKVVFLSDAQIWVMDANGSNRIQLTNETVPLTVNPTFSPDGTKIAFRKVRDVHVMNPDGTNQVNITNSGTLDNEPSYSPDGTKIAFKSYRNSNFEIYTMNADGSNQTRLTNTTAAISDSEPNWGSIAGVGVDLPELSAGPNSEFTIPLTVSDTSGWGILSYDLVLNYNPELLEPLATSFDAANTLSSNFEVNASASGPGQLLISGFGPAPLSGAGTLLNLKFRVIGPSQSVSSLSLNSITFNEGTPFAIASPGKVRVTGVMRGAVNYATSASAAGVPDVSILGGGSPNVSTTTGSDGTYELFGFGPGAYTVAPSKQGDINGITALDASLVSKFLVGTTTLTTEQQLAGEVSGNGSLSSFDAALIAQYVVGIAGAGQTGIWRFSPETRIYTSVANENGQDYLGFLMGEVSGNWAPQSSSLLNLQTERRPVGGVAASLPSLKSTQNQLITIPVGLSLPSGTALEGYQFDLVYDPQVIQPESSSVEMAGTLSSGLNYAVNGDEPGRLRLAVYGSNTVSSGGTLINLKFRVVGRAGSTSALTFNGLMLNEGNPAAEGRNGKVTVRR